MKRLFRFRLAWLGVLATVASLSVAGCHTATTREAKDPKSEKAAGSEAVGAPPCRFG
jgi:hypothetical protein